MWFNKNARNSAPVSSEQRQELVQAEANKEAQKVAFNTPLVIR